MIIMFIFTILIKKKEIISLENIYLLCFDCFYNLCYPGYRVIRNIELVVVHLLEKYLKVRHC